MSADSYCGCKGVTRRGLLTRARVVLFFFFFQAEDGIRDSSVTGVQTCALPISPGSLYVHFPTREGLIAAVTARAVAAVTETLIAAAPDEGEPGAALTRVLKIGRASCRERV